MCDVYFAKRCFVELQRFVVVCTLLCHSCLFIGDFFFLSLVHIFLPINVCAFAFATQQLMLKYFKSDLNLFISNDVMCGVSFFRVCVCVCRLLYVLFIHTLCSDKIFIYWIKFMYFVHHSPLPVCVCVYTEAKFSWERYNQYIASIVCCMCGGNLFHFVYIFTCCQRLAAFVLILKFAHQYIAMCPTME